MLGSLFQANAAIPVLLAWCVSAVLRLAQGSTSVAAITAATLLAPSRPPAFQATGPALVDGPCSFSLRARYAAAPATS
jgi:H+/gluconate symporter-like permease